MNRIKSLATVRRTALLVALPMLWLVGCQSNNGDTVVVNGLDCGLVRGDLFGDWTVTFVTNTANTVRCDNPAFNGTSVDVDSVPTVYASVGVFASPSGASFDVVGQGPNLPNELAASVEADSCLALVQKWEEDDGGWFQCIGTLDRGASIVPGLCDSIDLDTNADGTPDVACDLDRSVTFQAATL